jgi:hypothetical protein
MSEYWTWAQIRDKVEADLDMQDEDFVGTDEMLGYANEAIREAEAEIHTIYEDYFLKDGVITLAHAQEGYPLPADIYAHKIRKLVFNYGGKIFPVKRFRDWKKFTLYAETKQFGQGDDYACILVNAVPGSPELRFAPPPENGATVTIWYLRKANRLVNDSDVCDIPEFVNFILQYMKVRCYEKEGHPNLPKAMQDLEQQRAQMTGTLAGMIADDDNGIEPDYSHYEEHT